MHCGIATPVQKQKERERERERDGQGDTREREYNTSTLRFALWQVLRQHTRVVVS